MKKIFKMLLLTFLSSCLLINYTRAEEINLEEVDIENIEQTTKTTESEEENISNEIIDSVIEEVFDIIPDNTASVKSETEIKESLNEVSVMATKPSYELTINYIDTRLEGMEKQTKTYTNSSSTSSIKMNGYLGLSTTTANSIDEKDSEGNLTYYTYVFEGWFTEDGRKLNYTDYTDVDGVSIKIYNKSQYSTISFVFPTLEENKEINLYARWTKYYKPLVTVHIYDTKRFRENNEVYTNSTRLSLNSTTSVAYMVKLDQLFSGNDPLYTKFSYDGPYDKNKMAVTVANNSPVYFKFVKWADEKGANLADNYIDPSMTYEEEYKNILSSVEVFDKKVGNYLRKQMLSITAKSARNAQIEKDIDINIYVEWEGHTSAILSNEYIDEVSTGTGSWATESGGLINYTHEFSDPSIKTPTPHYKFLYWQYVDSDPIDDQVDPTKEYKDGDIFTYDLFNKPENWRGKTTAYAWWKPDVTLNLYNENQLLGTISSFESVSINDILTSNLEKAGYRFVGWTDENGKIVSETTFNANEKGIKPEPKTINLYAKWQKLVSINVTKEWDDTNNTEETTKPTVTINLINGTETVESIDLNEENNWAYTFVVPEFDDDNNSIKYEITENPVKGYTTSITGDITSGFVVKNTYIVTKMDITITKEWDDQYNEDEVRPTSVTVYLYANGEKIQDVEIAKEDGWSITLLKMPIYDEEGSTIEYSVVEGEVDYYVSTVTGNSKDGFVVKNYHEVGGKGEGEDPDEPTVEPVNNEITDNPKTGDNIFINITMLFISLLGLMVTVYLKKYSFNK